MIARGRILGFEIMTIPVYVGKSNNYTLQHLVRNVQPGSNAEAAGLKQMDLITHINGEIVQVRNLPLKNNNINDVLILS